MVTVRNDIEMLPTSQVPTTTITAAVAPDGPKVKDVNLKQEAQPGRRRSYRCITTVAVVTVVLLSLAVGSVFLLEYMNETPTKSRGDSSPPTVPEVPSAPTFADPFDGTSGQREISSEPVDDDEEIDIDETPSSETTSHEESISESSGDYSRNGDDTDEFQYSSGSGSGAGDMW